MGVPPDSQAMVDEVTSHLDAFLSTMDGGCVETDDAVQSLANNVARTFREYGFAELLLWAADEESHRS